MSSMSNETRIWEAIGITRIWVLADGSKPTEQQKDAIAMGLIAGHSYTKDERIWIYGPCKEKQARLGFRKWCTDSPTYHNSSFEEIRFQPMSSNFKG